MLLAAYVNPFSPLLISWPNAAKLADVPLLGPP